MSAKHRTHPLDWPSTWRRDPPMDRSRFTEVTDQQAYKRLLEEVRLWKVSDVVVSSNLRRNVNGLPTVNQRQPDDAGVALWFTLNGVSSVIACDRYPEVWENLVGLAHAVSAYRMLGRHCSQEMIAHAARGLRELGPAREDWREVLPGCTTIGEARRLAHKLLAQHHPDRGGADEKFKRVAEAWADARRAFGSEASK